MTLPTVSTRSDAVAAAETYLQGGLIEHDAERPWLAPTCFRHENGWHTGTTRAIRDHFPHMTMCMGIRDLRWIVELPWVALRFELLLDTEFGHSKPIAEWFRIGPRGIEEIAAVFPLTTWMQNALGAGSAIERMPRPAPARLGPEAGTVALGEAVVAALSDAGVDLSLASDVSLSENGVLSARSASATLDRLHAGLWPSVAETRVLQWVAEGSEAMARIELDTESGDLYACAVYVRVFDGLIRELDVRWGPGPSDALVASWRSSTTH